MRVDSIAAVFIPPESMSRKRRHIMPEPITASAEPEVVVAETVVVDDAAGEPLPEVAAAPEAGEPTSEPTSELASEPSELATTPTISNPQGLDAAGEPLPGWGKSYLIEPAGAGELPARVVTNCCDGGEAKRLYFVTLGLSPLKQPVTVTQVSDGG
jgi:hypothetical protein